MNLRYIPAYFMIAVLLSSCGSSKKAASSGGQEIVVSTAPSSSVVPLKAYDSLQKNMQYTWVLNPRR